MFAMLDGAIEIAVQCKKPKAALLVKWLTKMGVGEIQEEHQQAITDHDIIYKLFHAILWHSRQSKKFTRLSYRYARTIYMRKHTTSENDKYHDLPYSVS